MFRRVKVLVTKPTDLRWILGNHGGGGALTSESYPEVLTHTQAIKKILK